MLENSLKGELLVQRNLQLVKIIGKAQTWFRSYKIKAGGCDVRGTCAYRSTGSVLIECRKTSFLLGRDGRDSREVERKHKHLVPPFILLLIKAPKCSWGSTCPPSASPASDSPTPDPGADLRPAARTQEGVPHEEGGRLFSAPMAALYEQRPTEGISILEKALIYQSFWNHTSSADWWARRFSSPPVHQSVPFQRKASTDMSSQCVCIIIFRLKFGFYVG